MKEKPFLDCSHTARIDTNLLERYWTLDTPKSIATV